MNGKPSNHDDENAKVEGSSPETDSANAEKKPAPSEVFKAAKEAASKTSEDIDKKPVEVPDTAGKTADKIEDSADKTPVAKSDDEKRDKKRRWLVIILLLLALGLAGAGGYMLWKSMQPNVDPGATIQQVDGKTTKEIQEELDKQAEASRMTISVAPTVTLKDGKVLLERRKGISQ